MKASTHGAVRFALSIAAAGTGLLALRRRDLLVGTRPPRAVQVAPSETADARAARATVDRDRLECIVRSLPGPRSRLHAPEALAEAERLIAADLAANGWAVERRPFHVEEARGQLDAPGPRTSVTYPSLDGSNLVARLADRRDVEADPARDGERGAIALVAHHDTVRDAVGADDNGSGIAVVLELARLLAADQARVSRPIVVAFVDYEEIGLIGSRVLVERQLGGLGVSGAFVFDTVGFRRRDPGSQAIPPGMRALYPSQRRRVRGRHDAGDFAAVVYRGHSTPLAAAFAGTLQAVTGSDDAVLLRDPADLPVVGRLFARVPLTRNFSRSDHRSFWEAAIPAVLVSDTGNFRNPNYHAASDTPPTLDYDFLADVTAATYVAVSRLAWNGG